MKHLLCVSFLFFAAAASASQQTLVVGTGGTFTAIQPAIDAAQPGDTVLVVGGNYTESLDVDKGIALVSRGAQLRGGSFALTPVMIHDLPAGSRFVMRGFSAYDTGNGNDVGISVRDCAGSVSFHDLAQGGLSLWSFDVECVDQIHIGGCTLLNVNLDDSRAVIERSLFDPFAAGLSVSGGTTDLVACTISDGFPPFGGPAVFLVNGVLRVTRSDIMAAPPTIGGVGHPAIQMTMGELYLDPTTTLQPTGVALPVQGTGSVVAEELRTQTCTAQGSLLTLETQGVAGEGFATVMTFPIAELNTPFGAAWVDPFSAAILDVGNLPPGRLRVTSLALGPVPPGLTVAVQTLHFANTGWQLGSPSLVSAP